jgi:hypothetical protein
MTEKNYSLDHIARAGETQSLHHSYLYSPQIIKRHLDTQCKISSVYHTGIVNEKYIYKDVIDFLLEKGGTQGIVAPGGMTVLFENAYIYLSFNNRYHAGYDAIQKKRDEAQHTPKAKGQRPIEVTLMSTNSAVDEIFNELIEKFIDIPTSEKLIYAIVQTQTGCQIKSLGDASIPLIEDNYSESVIKDVEFSISAFKHNPPIGRILILNGVPGTGKTTLIRHLLSTMDNIFILVPSNLIDSLDKPSMLPLLLDLKNEHKKPIVFVIEDGDTCLVPRRNDNISAVTSLLNLSDGILGSLIDIRMIISSNTEIDNMDEAIMRPGRLIKNINVGALSYEHANRVYQRLMKDNDLTLPDRKRYTLAEIYGIFNNKDLPPVNVTPIKKAIGFGR